MKHWKEELTSSNFRNSVVALWRDSHVSGSVVVSRRELEPIHCTFLSGRIADQLPRIFRVFLNNVTAKMNGNPRKNLKSFQILQSVIFKLSNFLEKHERREYDSQDGKEDEKNRVEENTRMLHGSTACYWLEGVYIYTGSLKN